MKKVMSKNAKWEEVILVVDREELFENETLTFQGSTSDEQLVDTIMSNIDINYTSMRRGGTEDATEKENNAEVNMQYVQPIPYIVIRKGDQFYATQRLSGAGETRLHGKIAMGAGGHMNLLEQEDADFKEVLMENTMRELEEELDIVGKYELYIKGLINDDSDDVNRVHIGILGFLYLEDSGEVSVLETEQLSGEWLTLDQLKEKSTYDRLEKWGQIVVDML